MVEVGFWRNISLYSRDIGGDARYSVSASNQTISGRHRLPYLHRVTLQQQQLLPQSGTGDAGSGCGPAGVPLWPVCLILIRAQAVVADVVRQLVQLLSELLLLQLHLLHLRKRARRGQTSAVLNSRRTQSG